jgi:hypothetical protein
VHDIINKRRQKQPSINARMTDAATKARDIKHAVNPDLLRQLESQHVDAKQIPFVIAIVDCESGQDMFFQLFARKSRKDSYSLVFNDRFIGNFGGSRAMREAARYFPRRSQYGQA